MTLTLRPDVTLDFLRNRQRGSLPELLGVRTGVARQRRADRRIADPARTARAERLPARGHRDRSRRYVLRLRVHRASAREGAKNFTTVELKSNHVGTAREGKIIAKATAVHLGRSTQVWDATVTNARRQDHRAVSLHADDSVLMPHDGAQARRQPNAARDRVQIERFSERIGEPVQRRFAQRRIVERLRIARRPPMRAAPRTLPACRRGRADRSRRSGRRPKSRRPDARRRSAHRRGRASAAPLRARPCGFRSRARRRAPSPNASRPVTFFSSLCGVSVVE